jgi:hypothetical protein
MVYSRLIEIVRDRKMPMKSIRILLPLVALAAACGGGTEQERDIPNAAPSNATSADVGDYMVHYNAMTTDQLTPQVAQSTGIVRSKNRAMLNVSLVEKGTGRTVEGTVDVAAANLTGQTKSIAMRKVQDGNAIYYIGEVPVAHRETLVFDITVRPPGASRPSTVKFRRQFFTD